MPEAGPGDGDVGTVGADGGEVACFGKDAVELRRPILGSVRR
jgi:hypothetical protein